MTKVAIILCLISFQAANGNINEHLNVIQELAQLESIKGLMIIQDGHLSEGEDFILEQNAIAAQDEKTVSLVFINPEEIDIGSFNNQNFLGIYVDCELTDNFLSTAAGNLSP